MSEENKRIDGIKKLSREEIANARKIVLDTINKSSLGAQDKKAEEKKPQRPNMIDGLLRHQVEKKQTRREKNKKQEKSQKEMAPDFVHDKIAKEELEEENNQRSSAVKSKTGIEEEKRKAAQKTVERAQALEARKRRREKQKALEKRKRKEQRKEKRKKLKQKFYKKIKETLALAKIRIKIGSIKAIYLLLIAFVLSILFYLIFLILILKFDLDNNFTRRMAIYCPLPAVVTRSGIINYYEYKDFKKEIISSTQTGYADIKLLLAKEIVLNNLIKKYGVSSDTAGGEEETKKILSAKIAADIEINTVGLERIKKIKKLINKNGDFIQTANKFGDEQGLLNIGPDNKADYPFGEQVRKLNIGEISDIIITPEGYYIFKCYEKSKKTSGLSYVFIHSKGISEYLNKAAVNLKMWSLVD